MNSLVKKLLHVCITVPSVDRALDFYCGVLGFVSNFQTRTDQADGRLLGFDRDDVGLYAHHVLTAGGDASQHTEINLVEFTDPASTGGDGRLAMMNQVGLSRLALLVEDAVDAFERVRGYEGVQIVCEPKEIVIREPDHSFSMVWFSFRDPFGVFITMTQLPKS